MRTNEGIRDAAAKCNKTTALKDCIISSHNNFGIKGDAPVLSPDAPSEFLMSHQAIDFVPIPGTIGHSVQVPHR